MAMEATDKPLVHGLYGRQKGKRLGVYQSDLMQNHAQNFALDIKNISNGTDVFFKSYENFQMEIGFGGGEHIAHIAKLNPTIGYIACEPFENGVAKLIRACVETQIHNIKIYQGNTMDVVRVLPDQFLSRLYILYPDPWPKWRHRKRRIISDDHIKQFARILKSGSELRFATDIDDYSAWTLNRMAKAQLFAWQPRSAHDWLTPWDQWVQTRYEQKAVREKRTPAYYRFVKL